MEVLCSIVFCVIASIIFLLEILPVRIGSYIGILLMLIADGQKINIMKSMHNYISLKFDLYPKNISETSIEYALWRCFYILQQVFSSFVSNEGYQVHKIVWWIIFRKSHATGPSMLQITANCPYERLINFVTGKQKMIPFLAMGLLPDTQNCGLRMRRECPQAKKAGCFSLQYSPNPHLMHTQCSSNAYLVQGHIFRNFLAIHT